MHEPTFEGYQVLELVESGPVADVYRALQHALGRPVRIKALSQSILPSSPFAALLEREARLLAEMDHPNILRLHDFVRTPDAMWLVLEDASGHVLAEVLERSQTLPPAAAMAVALELARGLAHAHERGIVHRGLTPRHVLLTNGGGVKLRDFEVAAADDRLPTAPELLDGGVDTSELGYRSPEQILGESPDPRSDLFSLGVLLYRMLSGELPFDTPDHRGTSQRIRHEAPPPLARRVPDLPPSLDRIVQRCVEKLPSDRFAGASELAQALENALGDLRTNVDTAVLVLDALATAELVVGRDVVDDAEPKRRRAALPSSFSAVAGLLACFAAIVAIGAGVQLASGDAALGAAARGVTGLQLVPQNPGYLRVVADPWAHVVIDGERVETTPFAKPIPLEPGKHYVRLEHPNAAAERRDVDIVPGETVFLDVKMDVPRVPLPPPLPSASAAAGDGGADASPDAMPSP